MKGNQYFSHDFQAFDDPKIQEMVSDIGAEGYGIYWVIVEALYRQGGSYPIKGIKHLAHKVYAEHDTVLKVVKNYGLFEYDAESFWSPSQVRRQQEMNDRIERSKAGGRARAENMRKRQDEADKNDKTFCEHPTRSQRALCEQPASSLRAASEQELSSSDAQPLNKIKEIKEIKENNIDDKSSYGQGQEEDISEKEKKSEKNTEIEVTPQEVADVWNLVIKETGAPIRKKDSYLTDLQKQKIRLRVGEMKKIGPPLDVFETVVRKACASNFCCGGSDSGWLLKFDWVFKNSNNWHKIYQGDYDNRRGGNNGTAHLHIKATRPEDFEGAF